MSLKFGVGREMAPALVLLCAATLLFSTRAEATALWTPTSATHSLSLSAYYGYCDPNVTCQYVTHVPVFSQSDTSSQVNYVNSLSTPTFTMPLSGEQISGSISQAFVMNDTQIVLFLGGSVSTSGGPPNSNYELGFVNGTSSFDIFFFVADPLTVMFHLQNYDVGGFISGCGAFLCGDPDVSLINLDTGEGYSHIYDIVPQPFLAPADATLSLSPGHYEFRGGGSLGFASNGEDSISSEDLVMSLQAVPEPSTLSLLGVGIASLSARRRRARGISPG